MGVIVDSESKGESRNIYLHIKSEKYRLIIKGCESQEGRPK